MMENKKAVVVTGALGGMGKEVCTNLKKNYKVFALDLNIEEVFEKDDITYIPCDVTEKGSVIKARTIVEKEANEIYAIVHTAGIYDLDSLVEMDENRFKKIVEVNFIGAFVVNKNFFPLLNKGSRIVMISSELAPLDPLPFTGIYAVTKSALEKYAHSLRAELALKGIFVSLVRPGAVKTQMLGASTDALDKFCDNTTLYPVNAKRFRQIVDSVENKNVSPEKIAVRIEKALKAKRPKFIYNLNRNFLLRLLSILPKGMQVAILKNILK